MKFINLTPNIVRVVDNQGYEKIIIPASGKVASADIDIELIDEISGIKLVKYEYRNIKDLPDPEDGVYFIVSFAVLQALKNSRKDVISPDTSPGSVCRNKITGKIFGVKRFRKI